MIGDQVRVQYLARDPETRVREAAGRLGVVADEAGAITELVIELDGSALFIPRVDVLTLEVLS